MPQITPQENTPIPPTFDYRQALADVITYLPARSQEIVLARFGVGRAHPETLRAIGEQYGITRERVRQVVDGSIKTLRLKIPTHTLPANKIVVDAIRAHSSVMPEKDAVAYLGKKDPQQEGSVRFFLTFLEEVLELPEDKEILSSVATEDFNEKQWRVIARAVRDIFTETGHPLSPEEIAQLVAKKISKPIAIDTLERYMDVAQDIERNPFGYWGMAAWQTINPKSTRDRAYLVAKYEKRPIHFREMAQKIDQYCCINPHRKTHPQTVHNELIKDPRFALVGRGLYALTEWGYKTGTVRDIITEILTQSRRTLTLDEIYEQVSQMRNVKRATVAVNLKNYFIKYKNGTYGVRKK